MEAERFTIRSVRNPSHKTFVDLGAGYGRIIADLVAIARNVVALENNPGMLEELLVNWGFHPKVTVVPEDITAGLSQAVTDSDVRNPVFISAQNSLGTVEGPTEGLLKQLRTQLHLRQGELILSLFRQESLRTWGLRFYDGISEMAGPVDLQKTDVEKGEFVSQTGYRSTWRNKQQITALVEYLGGQTIDEIWAPEFCVLHLGPPWRRSELSLIPFLSPPDSGIEAMNLYEGC